MVIISLISVFFLFENWSKIGIFVKFSLNSISAKYPPVVSFDSIIFVLIVYGIAVMLYQVTRSAVSGENLANGF